jgi:polar amino acid transport system substrate-binding protein
MHIRRVVAAAGAAGLALSLMACSSPAPAEPAATASSTGGADTLFDQLPASVQDAGELVVAGDPHPPYRTVGDDGQTVTGIDPDLWEALSAELGVEVRMEVAASMPAILTGMQAGRWQAYNGPVQANAEREEIFDAITWLQTQTAYVVPADSDAAGADEAPCGLRVAIVTGSIVEGELDRLNDWCDAQGEPANEVVALADTNATILAVGADRADAAGMTETGAIEVLAATPDKYEYVTQTEDQGSGTSLLAMLTPKDSGLGAVLLEAFQRIFDNGEYTKVLEEWGLTEVAVDAPQINPVTGREPS